MRDFQRKKVYAWENEYIHKKRDRIPFDQIKTIVDYIWKNEGLLYPPTIELLNSKKLLGTGSRTTLCFQEFTSTSIILHELAHTLSATIEEIDRHGPDFVGIYINLIDKYFGINKFYLLHTAEKHGVKVNPYAKIKFLD